MNYLVIPGLYLKHAYFWQPNPKDKWQHILLCTCYVSITDLWLKLWATAYKHIHYIKSNMCYSLADYVLVLRIGRSKHLIRNVDLFYFCEELKICQTTHHFHYEPSVVSCAFKKAHVSLNMGMNWDELSFWTAVFVGGKTHLLYPISRTFGRLITVSGQRRLL